MTLRGPYISGSIQTACTSHRNSKKKAEASTNAIGENKKVRSFQSNLKK